MAADSLPDIEEWRPVPGYEGLYEVSSHGRVRDRRGRILKTKPSGKKRYRRAVLDDGQSRKWRGVHQLVCEAFHGPKPSPKHEPAHWNGDRHDNREDNLRWATRKENLADRERHGTTQHGEANPYVSLTADQVRQIRAQLAAGRFQHLIAADFGITQSNVSHIARRKIWVNLQ